MKIINETHGYWEELISNKTENKGGLAWFVCFITWIEQDMI